LLGLSIPILLKCAANFADEAEKETFTMVWAGLALYGAYVGLAVVAELAFYRKRGLSRWEGSIRALSTTAVAAVALYTLLWEPSPRSQLGFALIGGLSFLLFPLTQTDAIAQVGSRERTLHTFQSMLHPLMLILVATIWKFMDGAGLFVGMVLPFSTDHLRPLSRGFVALMGLIAAYQWVSWSRKDQVQTSSENTPAETEQAA
jgi:hypothetical protein